MLSYIIVPNLDLDNKKITNTKDFHTKINLPNKISSLLVNKIRQFAN